ncbi:solute:Na+ symporter, SSS family [Palleronia marisminoris]|uniref:Putative symporter YodF n=1 Tax=Palleronia marisminoris TaxID=315423 RepID=A0A1Y5RJL3_9RHOB|nr:sodium:solute symporter family protein [Palleronia marisminoris]SFG24284.1 solute:Na+ symporter, SSS family [Palleronia marisminoris]SLN18819.1 putative symporter YodF [Palleronia marisminoris]
MSTSLVIWGVVIYVVLACIIAWMSRRGSRATSTMSEYFLGGRTIGGVLSALSYSATTYSAFMMVGLAGLTYRGGVGALGFEIVYFAGVSLIAIFGPRFWRAGKRHGFVTPWEMLGHRYGSTWVAVAAGLVSLIFLIPYSAVQLSGVGYLLSGMTGDAIPFSAGIVLATVLAIVFAFVAGIRSVVWTDSLQALVMMVASLIVGVLVVSELGGFLGMFETIAATRPEMLKVPGPGLFSFTTFLGLTLPWFFFSISNPQVSQRLFMPSSLGALRRMLLIFLCFGLVYTIISVLWGFSALVAFPDLENADRATARLLSSEFVPPILGVAVMIGILAAAVSTIDSILLTLSSIFARDVWGNLGGGAADASQLKVGKIVIPVISILALIFAAMEISLIAILSVAASAGLVVTVPAIVGAFFWRRGTAAGALASIAGGAAFVGGMYLTGNALWGLNAGVLGLPVATILFVAVSLVTRPSTRQTTEGYVGT